MMPEHPTPAPRLAGLLACGLLMAATHGAAADDPVKQVDHLFVHGRIHTQDSSRSTVEAMAVRDGEIVGTGSEAELHRLVGPNTVRVDLGGRTVLPGLIDAHIHPAASAQDMDKCSLGDESLPAAGVLDKIRACLAANPGQPGSWFEVVQVNPSGLALDAAQLDGVLPDRPLVLEASDGHNVWANHPAMIAAGVTAETRDPTGGRVERDPQGRPAGGFRDSAQGLILGRIPRPDLETEAKMLAKAFAAMHAVGLTSVQDASVDDHLMSIYKRLWDTGRLDMRVRGSFRLVDLAAPPEKLIDEAKSFRARWAVNPDFLRADAVKIFADGVIESPSQTAALLAPYLDATGKPTANRGPTYVTPEALKQMVYLADSAGFTVHIHAIGDRAVRSALDAFDYTRDARAKAGLPASDNRHQIAHLELIDPADYPRFGKLGVIANFQLDWADVDAYVRGGTFPYLGPERSARLYPARSLRDAGAVIAGGSDWNVSTFDPFEAMERGVTRRIDRGSQPLAPDQALTLQDMVDAYTINAARALRQETTTGSLEPGRHADFIVLTKDPFALDPYDIHTVRVGETWVAGKQVYRDTR